MQSSFLSPEAVSLMSGMPMAEPPPDYRLPDRFPDLTREKRIIIDLESHDPTLTEMGPGWRRNAYIAGIGVKAGSFSEYYPVGHTVGPSLDRDKVFEYIGNQLAFYTGEVLGANLLYDFDGFQYQNIAAPMAKFRDVQWDEALLDEYAYSYSLNTLAKKYLGRTKVTNELEELYGEDYILRFRDIHPGHARAYVLGDVELPELISDEQKKELKKQHLTKLSDIEHRLFPFLLYLRRNGVRVDKGKAEQLSSKFAGWVKRKLQRASHFAGQEVNEDNFGRPAFLAKILQGLGVEIPRTKPTEKAPEGNYSITDAWLKKLANPFGKQLAGARKFSKAQKTFAEGFALEHAIGDRIFPQFHPLRRVDDGEGSQGTITGRFSCTDPNLQQIPTRDKVIGPLCRSMFIADEGAELFAMDYSQLQFRILVHYATLLQPISGDSDRARRRQKAIAAAQEAQRMYREDPTTDFHNMVVTLTGLERKPAKNLNFGLIFGMTKGRLARELKLVDANGKPNAKCEEIFATYHDKVAFVKDLMDTNEREADSKGFITTILDRRGRFPLFEPANWRNSEEGYTERPKAYPLEEAKRVYGDVEFHRAELYKALNKRIQGTEADLFKTMCVNLWDSGILFDNDFSLSLLVHDEVVGSYVPSEKGKKALAEAKHIMETSMKFNVPILTECGTGESWAEAK